MVSRWLFTGFIAALGLQRLFELRLSRRNETRILRQGGREHTPATYHWIVGLHMAWFVAMLVEVFAGGRKFRPHLAALALTLFAVGQALRLTAIRTLGWRWSTRVMTVPGTEPVSRGIYRYIRHPNYLGVELEILSVPLIYSAYITSTVFGVANAFLLRDRIRREEQALAEDNQYREVFGLSPYEDQSAGSMGTDLSRTSSAVTSRPSFSER